MKKTIEQNLQESHARGVEFCITDAETALTLLDSADATSNPENRARRIGEARTAYDTILKLMPKLQPEPAQLEALNQRLAILRSRLHEAGAFSSD